MLSFLSDSWGTVEHTGALLKPGFPYRGVISKAIALGFQDLDLGSGTGGARVVANHTTVLDEKVACRRCDRDVPRPGTKSTT